MNLKEKLTAPFSPRGWCVVGAILLILNVGFYQQGQAYVARGIELRKEMVQLCVTRCEKAICPQSNLIDMDIGTKIAGQDEREIIAECVAEATIP